MTDQVNEAAVERVAEAMYYFPWSGATEPEKNYWRGKARLALTPLQAAQPAVPDGMVLVPERMHLSVEALEALSFHCGGVDPESTDLEERWCSGTLWVGDILDDDGKPTHGLHLSNDECPEEGSVTLVEFAAALQAAQPAVPSMSEAAKWAKKVRDFSWRLDAHEQDIADELVAFLESFAATPAHDQPEGDES